MPLITTLVGCALLHATAADWAGWRGPDGLGVSSEKGLPVTWSKDQGVAWKVAIPGKGASSPIVVGNRVYLTSQTADNGLHVLAIDLKDGKILWDQGIGKGRLRSHNLHNMATPTAASDGKFVWVLFGTGELACLDKNGKVVWQRNLVKEYGEYKTNHGYGTSPMLLDGKLFIACMHQGSSYVVAVDAKTGKNVWKKDRNLDAKEEAQDSYSSAIFVGSKGHKEVVLEGAESVNAYDPATGEQVWICGGFKVPHPYGRTIAGVAAGDGAVIVTASGFQNRGYVVGVKTGGKGDITQSHKLWTATKFAPDCPTPVVYEGKVYTIRDDGMASCFDVKTGEAHWQERLTSANVKVSPVAADGKIYFLNGQGGCTVVKASAKFEKLADNELGEGTLSSPAVSGGRILIRTEGHLHCIKR